MSAMDGAMPSSMAPTSTGRFGQRKFISDTHSRMLAQTKPFLCAMRIAGL